MLPHCGYRGPFKVYLNYGRFVRELYWLHVLNYSTQRAVLEKETLPLFTLYLQYQTNLQVCE